MRNLIKICLIAFGFIAFSSTAHAKFGAKVTAEFGATGGGKKPAAKPGPAGKPGVTGKPGPAGKPGKPGKPGKTPPAPAAAPATATVTVTAPAAAPAPAAPNISITVTTDGGKVTGKSLQSTIDDLAKKYDEDQKSVAKKVFDGRVEDRAEVLKKLATHRAELDAAIAAQKADIDKRFKALENTRKRKLEVGVLLGSLIQFRSTGTLGIFMSTLNVSYMIERHFSLALALGIGGNPVEYPNQLAELVPALHTGFNVFPFGWGLYFGPRFGVTLHTPAGLQSYTLIAPVNTTPSPVTRYEADVGGLIGWETQFHHGVRFTAELSAYGSCGESQDVVGGKLLLSKPCFGSMEAGVGIRF